MVTIINRIGMNRWIGGHYYPRGKIKMPLSTFLDRVPDLIPYLPDGFDEIAVQNGDKIVLSKEG